MHFPVTIVLGAGGVSEQAMEVTVGHSMAEQSTLQVMTVCRCDLYLLFFPTIDGVWVVLQLDICSVWLVYHSTVIPLLTLDPVQYLTIRQIRRRVMAAVVR